MRKLKSKWRYSKTHTLYITLFHDIPYFIKNMWNFKKELYEYRPWDYTFNLNMLKKSLEQTCDYIEKYGIEEKTSKSKKVKKIKRAVEIIENIVEHKYIDIIENKLGYKVKLNYEFTPVEEVDEDGEHLLEMKTINTNIAKLNKKVYKLSDALEEKEWKELCSILQGQDITKHNNFNKHFNGSGMRNWWD